ncbi:MAG TPA: AlkA N-terminal domain-containing protein [Verrucomicrobiae bacterium]|jgi:AraC family transcriptional regulator, regulatory protein of adaptative response / DNA-3-methyladenine glycosylase II|nr:AlkA N-terminal domain-containing protein [Verrucomicrobiae bacterium]
MTLDWHICSRARLSRDPRFDGKFFIGVLGSGVYCRPICPAPTAKEKNVRYFPTAAAAAEAGFRPCLRCRPECSPGTPAWSGTSTTVSRALRLIGESGLEDGGVEMLAQKLGVGSRHLRRLFLRHLGATPLAVAQTRRLHFAKKLIDETTLPMNHVALAAGFGSVRRFNAHIQNVYHRTPTQIRRLARQTFGRSDLAHHSASENLYSFRLRFRPPYHWPGILAFLVPRCTPGVEAVVDGVYRRSIAFQSHRGYFEVSLDSAHLALDVRLHFGNPRSLFFIIERIRTMFDLSADWHAIERTLGADPTLAEIIHAQPGLRVPGSWDGFELAVRAILGQQTTVKGATALAGKIARAFGEPFDGPSGLTHLFPSPETLAKADLSTMGLPATRAAAIRALARAVCDHTITFEGIIDANAFLDRLCRIPGIGKWTAQYVAMRALAEPDAFPSGDRGLSRVLGLDASNEIERRAESWRPWRSYAVMYLWRLESESCARKSRRASPRLESPTSVDASPHDSAAL